MNLNPEARKQMGEAARKKIEAELTWDAVAKKYLEMFEEARRSSGWLVTGGRPKVIQFFALDFLQK